MGLDAWVLMKSKRTPENNMTGVCSGLFPIVPKNDGMSELCYLRKGYDQDEFLCQYLGTKQEESSTELRKEDLPEMILEIETILKTHTFNEDGEDLESDWVTWQSKWKWEQLLEGLKKAMEIINEDPEAELFYCTWA